MCNKGRRLRVSNVEARLKRDLNDRVHMVSGVRVERFSQMRPVPMSAPPRVRRYRSIDYCSACLEVLDFKPELRA